MARGAPGNRGRGRGRGRPRNVQPALEGGNAPALPAAHLEHAAANPAPAAMAGEMPPNQDENPQVHAARMPAAPQAPPAAQAGNELLIELINNLNERAAAQDAVIANMAAVLNQLQAHQAPPSEQTQTSVQESLNSSRGV